MRFALATVTIASLVLVLNAPAARVAAAESRQQHVEHESKKVMPFGMDATMHVFEPNSTGGVQTVMVTNGSANQVVLVRSHLRKEAAAFARGDFTGPASIHGAAMPGLRTMRARAHRMAVRYADVRNGGAITYATRDPALVSAIHAWFRSQVSDHGSHATMHM